MSTPSTITATFPPPHHNPHYGYSNHQVYQANAGHYGPNGTLVNGSSRIAPSYSNYPTTHQSTNTRNTTASSTSRPPQQSSTAPVSQSTPTMQEKGKRERRPDWNEFYKNGVPKEIILIEDSPPPLERVKNERVNHTTRTVMREPEHATKKRKTGQKSVYDTGQFQQPSYSNPRATHDHNTGSTTISTDRTTSLQTTAPTSLGSHTSHGSIGAYVDDGMVGQKRKRVTRQQTADEKKRKEIETNGDAYSSYVPPPKPPIKAKEVHVPPVRDVRLKCSIIEHWLMSLDFDKSAKD